MRSHELARRLLMGPDLPVATHANNHTYSSAAGVAGPCRVAVLEHYAGLHIIIGNFTDRMNPPNWYLKGHDL